jgi:hypothetical protein
VTSQFLRALPLLAIAPALLYSQDNYEIQVYGAETVAPGRTMVELHNNFTISGSKNTVDGLFPTQHSWHETIEITQGVNEWFEVGFYIFMSANTRYGYQWVGDHIRPRVRAPEKWKWPVGVSLSMEAGYQRRQFSADTWTWEIRPIVDKKVGRWYLSFNPTFDRSFHGPGIAQGVGFSPNFKAGYDVTKKINVGLEYYGALGPVTGFDPIAEQQQQIIPAVDLDLGPDWEFNFGVGVGVTHGTDHLLVKMILGRRFSFGSARKGTP